MSTKSFIIAALLIVGPAIAAVQAGAAAEASVIVSGEVVRYEPGKMLVIRSEGREVSYTIEPSLVIPGDVQVGKTVWVESGLGPSGSSVVSRITTTVITPEGQTKRTTEETTTGPSGGTTKTTTVTIQGSVQSYMPGKSITILRTDGTTKTFTITPTAKLPSEIATGKAVTILTLPDGSIQTITVDKE